MKRVTRRGALRVLAPTGLLAMFTPLWLRTGELRLPPVLAAAPVRDRETVVDPRDPRRVNQNFAMGRVEALNSNAMVVRDAEGLHVISLAGHPTVEAATNGPAYARLVDNNLRRIHAGDTALVTGPRQPDGSIRAEQVILNLIVGGGGIVQSFAAPVMAVRMARSWMTDKGFAEAPSNVVVDPNVVVQRLNSARRYVAAKPGDMRMGQLIAFRGLRAPDGTVVVTFLNLGNGEPPGY